MNPKVLEVIEIEEGMEGIETEVVMEGIEIVVVMGEKESVEGMTKIELRIKITEEINKGKMTNPEKTQLEYQ